MPFIKSFLYKSRGFGKVLYIEGKEDPGREIWTITITKQFKTRPMYIHIDSRNVTKKISFFLHDHSLIHNLHTYVFVNICII